MEAQLNTHIKLLASDFLSLTPSPTHPTTTLLRNSTLPITHIETVGIITNRDHKLDRFLLFTIDDGTGTIPCVLWLNQLTSPYYSRRCPPSVRLIAEAAKEFSGLVEVGVTARMRGKVGVYRGVVQLTVSDVFVERDPNVETLHWLQCIRLARKCYDNVVVNEKERS